MSTRLSFTLFCENTYILLIVEILGFSDYVIIDSDIVWYKDIKFKANDDGKYYYTYGCCKNQQYENTMFDIARIKYTPIRHDCGISHHMVMGYKVLSALKTEVANMHGKPLWFMMLAASAQELTCRGEI